MALLQGLALGTLMELVVRPADERDASFLARMLSWAGSWRSEELDESVLTEPAVSRYLEDWGRPGDFALIAEAEGSKAGAAWYRLFPADEPGYGFVDERTPEVTVGVEPSHRGSGVGRSLLEALAEAARDAGHPALSLSVEVDNPALRLYERVGFERRAQRDGAWALVLPLA